MNSMNVPSKRSTLERKLDKLILLLFCILFMICFIGAIGRLVPSVLPLTILDVKFDLLCSLIYLHLFFYAVSEYIDF